MKPMLKISHIAILIKSISSARKFYGEILQLEEIERPEYFMDGLWYKIGDYELHLMLCENALPPSVHALDETAQPHFALSMHKSDFDKTIKYLTDSGIQFIGNIEQLNGVMQAFFYDYDRNMIEINNSLSSY